MKQFRESLKVLSWVLRRVLPQQEGTWAILMYHRVTGDSGLQLDVDFRDFEAQMRWLARHGRVVSLDEALDAAEGGVPVWHDRPTFVLTFDDAFQDFYTTAWPILQGLGFPSTLYVPTGFVEHSKRVPLSRGVKRKGALAPVSWAMLGELVESPLVTIGAHTHGHYELPSLSDHRVEEEICQCDELLQEKLGIVVKHFAYPRGVWDERVERFVKKHYRSAVHVGGGPVTGDRCDRYRLPRIPVQASDRMRWFEARIGGDLRYEESAVRILKRLGRSTKKREY